MRTMLLDTNAWSRLAGGDQDVLDVIGAADRVFMSAVVLGELHAGFALGTRRDANEAVLRRFLERPTVRSLDVTAETAEVFGGLKAELRRAGTPIPIADVWIAAQALETGAVLATFDAHMARVPGLRLWPAPDSSFTPPRAAGR